jgi:hypothetical protein
MLIYRITDGRPDRAMYAGTQAEAIVLAKSDYFERMYVELELLEVKPDKENVLRMLAGDFPKGVLRLKVYQLTARGGLRTCAFDNEMVS